MHMNILRDLHYPKKLRQETGDYIQNCPDSRTHSHDSTRAGERVRGVPKWARVRMRGVPLEPSVELLMGPRNV